MCCVPGYKESCTSVFTEESRRTGDFCPSISGIITTPPVDSCATTRFGAVQVFSGCRTRLREPRLAPDGGLPRVGGGRTVIAVAPVGVT